MAKRVSNGKRMKTGDSRASTKIETFAEDLGRMLGAAQTKAEGWLGQRKDIARRLVEIRDTASKLLVDMGHQAERIVRRVGTGRRAVAGPKVTEKPQRRTMSAKARQAISIAQKKRWAAVKADAKEK